MSCKMPPSSRLKWVWAEVMSQSSKECSFSTTFAQKCKVIYERDPKSHARYIIFALPTHKGQPQHRELHALQRRWWFLWLVVIIFELFHPIVWLVWQACFNKAEFSLFLVFVLFFCLQRRTAVWCSCKCVVPNWRLVFPTIIRVHSLCNRWNEQSRSIVKVFEEWTGEI